MSINTRFKQLRKTLKLSQTELASALDKTLTMVQYYEYGERNITDGILLKLNEKFGVSIDWLRSGVGEMFNKAVLPLNSAINNHSILSVPIKYYSDVNVSAGLGAFVDNERYQDYYIDHTAVRSKAFDVVINVSGDSMNPVLQDKDMVLINTNSKNIYNLRPKRIYVIYCSDGILIKRFKKNNGCLYVFSSDNKKYKDIQIDFSDDANRVIGVLRGLVYREIQPDIDDDTED